MGNRCLKSFKRGVFMMKEEIKAYLPHRAPMLLVDEATLSEDGNVAYGKYHVKGDEWFLQGHFPGNPVVPGVILCEIMAQTCGILLGENMKDKTPYYTGMDKVRFKNKVFPGDTLEITSAIVRSKNNFYFTKCSASVNGKLCAQGELSCVLVEGR
jgi:3-hydroxyacyl-[acyl-carrier-protein] dehydratase